MNPEKIPEPVFARIETTIEQAGDYVKYQNRQFFQDFHKMPTVEARCFRGDGGDDESIDEEIRHNIRYKKETLKYRPSIPEAQEKPERKCTGAPKNQSKRKNKPSLFKDRNDDLFLEEQMDKSTLEYDRVRREVISRLYELGMVKDPKKIKSNKFPLKKSNSCIVNNIRLDLAPPADMYYQAPGENRKSHCSISVNDLEIGETATDNLPEIQKQTSKGFLTRFGKSLTDMFARPFKKSANKRRGRARSDSTV